MQSPFRSLSGLGLAILAGTASAQITFFDAPRFGGRQFTANQAVANFTDIGFNDRAASAIIRGGTWQLCTDAYFRGRCESLGPGNYQDLGVFGVAYAISSTRELTGWPGPGGGVPGGSQVVLYEGANFSGGSFDVGGTIVNFADTGFNDRAQSMVIQAGSWRLCVDANFGGYCQDFGPGRYADLGPLTAQLSSIQPVGSGGAGGGGWGGGSRAILYENPNLSGRTFVINNQVVANLDGTGFNDRASSLRVEGGYWIFCSDANFNGECQTFPPGDYPYLSGLSNRISSGRRVSGSYPYDSSPHWSGQR